MVAAGVAGAGASWLAFGGSTKRAPIKVGIIHSLTGTMAISERPVVDATMLAIEDINDRGGLLGGRRLVAMITDGASDPPTFRRESERLIVEEGVSVVFGCWTSASRRTTRPVFEQYDHLLFYPVQYEGLELSPAIVYTGAAPNQQVIPAVKWAMDNLGSRFFLVGSDYVFPRTANAIITDQVRALGGAVLGEAYIPLGDTDVANMVERIRTSRPDAIFNSINGDSNVAFFKALRAAGITPAETPTVSFSISENELRSLGPADMVGDYAALNYFQSIARQRNLSFVERFHERFGLDYVIGDPMEAAWVGVNLWAQAVEQAGTDSVRAVRDAIRNQSLDAPEGVVFIDPETQHTWKTVRIGRIRDDGQFDVVWSSDKPVRPIPYPGYRTRSDWDAFLEGLQAGWDGDWAAPVPFRGYQGVPW